MWIEFAVEMVLITLVIYDTEIEESSKNDVLRDQS